MKTEGYTLVEAVKAMLDGKCRGAKRPAFVDGIFIGSSDTEQCGELVNERGRTQYVMASWFNSSDWQLIDPVPEKRTVKGWIQIVAGRNKAAIPELCCDFIHHTANDAAACCPTARFKNLGDPFYIEHTYEVTE